MSEGSVISLDHGFAEKLLGWFAVSMRPFPWRKTYDAYAVWISEIMLQQTQAERGAEYFRRWMRLFPDVPAVAEADGEAVLAAWEGLGYYSRARNLHAAARLVVERHGGEFPRDLAAIRALPGVGEYTAGAIASIAFNLPVPAVDANVMRIFSRLLDLAAPLPDADAAAVVTERVRSLMPDGSARMFNQALMEFGALICGRKPKCGGCPVREHCAALERGVVELRPVKRAGAARTSHEAVAGIILRGGRVLVGKRPPGGLWGGLWEFPGGEAAPGEAAPEALRRLLRETAGISVSVGERFAGIRHGYTTHRVVLHGFLCSVESGAETSPPSGMEWATPAELAGRAFSAGHRKLLERLGWK